MYCTNCGKLVNDNASVCLSCGVAVGRGKKFCAHCGSAHDPEASVCLKCGVAIKRGADKNSSQDAGACIKSGFKNMFKFKGRMSRAEYWWYYLIVCIINLVVTSISSIVVPTIAAPIIMPFIAFIHPLLAVVVAPILAILLVTPIPFIVLLTLMSGATVRRHHDIGKSGWYSLFFFLSPLTFGLTAIVTLVFALKPGEKFENEYGPARN